MSVTSAFTRDATALDVVAGRDFAGQVVFITGGASGIGLEPPAPCSRWA
ncbi:hypothetical protein [Deinococcus sp.]